MKRPLQLFGQELNHVTYAIAKMNMIIHDMEGEIAIGDTLDNPKFLKNSKLKTFDLVAANPMWNQPGYGTDFYEADRFNRFRFGFPPERSADWGWLQHILSSLKSKGRAAVVLDAAAVTRGSGEDVSKEKVIRRGFVDEDLVEGVILLPDNLFYNTSAQGIIIVLNTKKVPKLRGQVILVDASDEFRREKPKNILTDSGTARILSAFSEWKTEEGFSRVVPCEEIVAKDYNLNPARYVARTAERVPLDVSHTINHLEELRGQASELDSVALDMIAGLRARNSGSLPKGWQEVAFGDVASFVLGRTPPRKKPEYFMTADGVPWVTITDMANQVVVHDTKEEVSEDAFRDIFRKRIVPAGTLLMSIKLTVGRTAFMGFEGVHNEAIVSISPDESKVLPKFLFYLLPLIDYRQYQDRAVKGQTINLGKLRIMRLALPPIEEQKLVVEVLDTLQELVAIEHEVARSRSELRDEMIHKLASGQLRVKSND